MKTNATLLFSAVFLLGLISLLWAGGLKEERPAGIEEKSLIRKELLARKKQELKPPRRNIFSLRNSPQQEMMIPPVSMKPRARESAMMDEKRTDENWLNLRYIGHIISGQKVVALILLEGNVLTVEKGEVIAEGMVVGELTPLAIEIIGPDTEKRKYPLEGEK